MEPSPAGFPNLHPVIRPLYPPMEALAVDALPPGAEWLFEPTSDGFRCFRHGTTFLRWRPDQAPRLGTFAQLEGGRHESLAAFWGRRAG
jgi:hypothetical protein